MGSRRISDVKLLQSKRAVGNETDAAAISLKIWGTCYYGIIFSNKFQYLYTFFFQSYCIIESSLWSLFFLPVPSRTHFCLRFSRSIEKQLMDEAFLRPWTIKEQQQEQLTCCAHLMRIPQQPKPFRFSIDSPSMRPSFLETTPALLVLEFHSRSGRKLQCDRWSSPPRHDWNLEPQHLGF